MIVTDQFVFLHLHKSGGTFVNHCLLRFFPSARLLGYHFPYKELPAQYRNLPVLGFVRNPWAYYVSWYSFQRVMKHPNLLFLTVSENRKLDFNSTITNLVNLSQDEQKLAFLIQHLPESYAKRGLNLTKESILFLRQYNRGFYSFLFQWLFKGCNTLYIGKMETLQSDLYQFFDRYQIQINASAKQYIKGSAKQNVSKHQHYSTYYQQPLIDLIQGKDEVLIERHAYQFEYPREEFLH